MNRTGGNTTLLTCGSFAIVSQNLSNISSFVHNTTVFLITVNSITCPLIILLNILVMVAVKTKRQLRTTSNVALACLATTDLVVGLAVQPLHIACYILILRADTETYRSLTSISMAFTVKCLGASYKNLFLMSGERYLAIKHPFAHENFVTEVRIIMASAVAWLLSVVPPVELDTYMTGQISFSMIVRITVFVVLVYSNIAVYLEVRRIEKHIIANQVSLEAKEKIMKDKKAFYTTTIVLLVIILCYIPILIHLVALMPCQHSIPANEKMITLFLVSLFPVLNSLLNPLIYAVRIRYFRVAFIQLLSRKTVAQAEGFDKRIFGRRQVEVMSIAEQEKESAKGD